MRSRPEERARVTAAWHLPSWQPCDGYSGRPESNWTVWVSETTSTFLGSRASLGRTLPDWEQRPPPLFFFFFILLLLAKSPSNRGRQVLCSTWLESGRIVRLLPGQLEYFASRHDTGNPGRLLGVWQ